ncbi:hypothetical protein HG263_21235 [Pseudoalteromonas sp. JBTF-M23]|uniref:Lipoprotein n=1 Tax=Pseudoalteromonas caenipelagi TaxID=2726988 RepID=A0A849VH03_9GAMM|nr:hypothetical protein [Pseudoalteromonas caenipelagi]NOU53029.1 hypothetical protein [Pseudoalteromonas caenipelagi]
MKQQFSFILIVLFGSLLSGCHITWTTAPSKATKSNYEILDSLVADKACDASYQCKVLAVGERPSCKGPSQYIIYSTKRVNELKLNDIAKKITEQERFNNAKTSLQETCKPILPITPLCIKQQCQTYRP